MLPNEGEEVRPVVSLPFSISGISTRAHFRKPRRVRLHTSALDDLEPCRKPLEVKEYSNKFLRATDWQDR